MQVGQDRVSLNTQRGKIYKLLSMGYLYPESEFIQGLKDGGFTVELIRAIYAVPEAPALKQAMNDAARPMKKSGERFTTQDFGTEFDRLFTVAGGERGGLLYETTYTAPDQDAREVEHDDVSRTYAHFGIEPVEGSRPDHISAELEFMFYMAVKESQAEKQGDPDGAQQYRKAARVFLENHLSRYTDALCRKLEERSSIGFYPALARLTRAFVDYELATL